MMASSPPTARRAQQHSAALSRVGSSKNHSALAKIIAIISMTPSPTSPPRPEPDALRLGGGDPEAGRGRTTRRPPTGEPGGLSVDLRLRLGSSPQIGGGSVEGDGGGPTEQSGVVNVASAMAESGRDTEEAMAAPAAALAEPSLSPVASVVAAAKSSEGECDPEEENEEETREATAKEAKEKAFAEQKATKEREAAQVGTTTAVTRDRGSLDLLLEAVRQVSGGLFDDDGPAAEKPEPAAAAPAAEGDSTPRKRRSAGGDGGGGKKQREEEEVQWRIPFDLYEEETAPIVLSKRGRNQTLSSRYRDSILNPWRKPAALPRRRPCEGPMTSITGSAQQLMRSINACRGARGRSSSRP